ncbi:HPF/RaiA family ribosome-associated protein [Salipiger mucosus]|uniref:Cold-shock DNA-binding protein domain protein n=1 Tax=Salipiger mucosus DSM 16094 TaxID=1123237 RepID=S9SBT8_9RHOB|nr:HPF/RaiA family ribosome-associated protein [Salipiger mucosus]EPX83689.1 cold-shock DNA-binding protein domain protein [Salipiger mucosus DSM 16094]
MQTAPVITSRNLDASPSVNEIVGRRVAGLEKIEPEMIGCEVILDAPQKRKRHGRVLRVRLHLHLPGPDLSVSREVAQGSARDDLLLAVNRAFSAAETRLKRRKKVMDAVEVKHHPPVLHGVVTTLEPELGYGWLRADDGREVYLQRDALTSDDWEKVETGTRLRFRERQGDKGPYATGVTLAE